MALTDAQRRAIWADFQRDLSSEHEEIGPLTKPQLRAAFSAVDDWIDANAASFNAALPAPAKAALTARQKARMFALVVQKRLEVS